MVVQDRNRELFGGAAVKTPTERRRREIQAPEREVPRTALSLTLTSALPFRTFPEYFFNASSDSDPKIKGRAC